MTEPARAGRSALIEIIARQIVRAHLAAQVAGQPPQGHNPGRPALQPAAR